MKKTNQLILLCSIIMLTIVTSCKQEMNCDNCPKEVELPEGTFTYSDEGRTEEMLKYDQVVTMLKAYDKTRIAPLKNALGYEDSRINTYNFKKFMKYLGHVMSLSKKAGVEINGISFISAVKENYKGTGKSYQDLIYIPTTMVNGKEIPFDPVQSAKQGKLVTFKEMLAKNGFNWIYNTKEDYTQGKNNNYDYSVPIPNEKGASLIDVIYVEESGAGNRGHLVPPYSQE